MSQAQRKDSLVSSRSGHLARPDPPRVDPRNALRDSATLRRLRDRGILSLDKAGNNALLWAALMRSPFGKAIGLVSYRTVIERFGMVSYPVPLFLVINRPGYSQIGGLEVQNGKYLVLGASGLAALVTSIGDVTAADEFAAISDFGDVQFDLSELEQAEFDFRHCPRVIKDHRPRVRDGVAVPEFSMCSENCNIPDHMVVEYDPEEYFSRLERLNGTLSAHGKPMCREGITPSVYGD